MGVRFSQEMVSVDDLCNVWNLSESTWPSSVARFGAHRDLSLRQVTRFDERSERNKNNYEITVESLISEINKMRTTG